MRPYGLCVALLTTVFLTIGAAAQDPRGLPVGAIELDGVKRASEQLIRSQIEVQVGQPYNPSAVSRDIRRLYDLGFFSLIQVDAGVTGSALTLIYRFEEKLVVDEIRIIGSDKIKQRDIRAELQWREGDSFVEDAYAEERDAILSLYQSKGFANAKVDIIVEQSGPGRVRVIYSVDEGKKARVKKMTFTGNEVLADRKLRKLMKTKRAWWFLGGKYDTATFETDLEHVVDEYGDYGRLEAEVVETQFDYRDGGKKVDVSIILSEGPEYTVETLDLAGNVVYDDDEILGLLRVQAGDVHNRGQIVEDADLVQKGYADSGYVRAAVTPQVTLDRDKKTTHVVHRAAERDLKYIREITITGNSITKDSVIRRDMLLSPGDRFDGSLLRFSQQRIDATEFFDSIRLNLEDDEDDRFTNLLLDLEEGKTGNFNFGVGFSTDSGIGGSAEIRLNNFDWRNWPTFDGGGQQLRIRLALGEQDDEFSISFTDPEIGGYPLAFGIDLYNERHRYTGGTDFTEEVSGAQIRFGKILSPYVTARTSFGVKDANITDFVGPFTRRILKDLQGEDRTISNIWGINRTQVDSKRDTSSGYAHDFQVNFSLFGQNEFIKVEHDSTWYWPFGEEEKFILSLRTREGLGWAVGDTPVIPLSDRFYAGGTTTVRGYESRSIGPTIRRYFFFGEQINIGGEMRMVQNLELKYKFADKLRFYAFVDGGGVWNEVSDFEMGDYKLGAGIGFGVEVPRMGPIRLDYGIPINPEDYQGNGRLHLTTGFRF